VEVIMAKRGSLKYQIIMDLDSLQRYGQSKKMAKEVEYANCKESGVKWNPSKVEGIYSISTYDKYKDICIKFGEWAKKEFGVKDLESLKKNDLVLNYLLYRQKCGDSPYTLRLFGSAIAKFMRCSSNDFGFEFPARNRENIDRSRSIKFHDSELSFENNKDIILFGEYTGLRRTELSLLKPEQIEKDGNGNVYIEINKRKYGSQSKGGKDRIILVLPEGKDHVWNMKVSAVESGRSTVFEKVNNRIDVHSLRRKFAQSFYNKLALEKGDSLRSDYFTRDGTKRRFDRGILRVVSNSLGHNRITVIVKHYLD
jgi:hypothetical protein